MLTAALATDLRQDLLEDRTKTLENLYAKTFPMVLHHVKQHGGTAEDAQDLLQEAIVLLYEKVTQTDFTLSAAASTYLMAVCKNQWLRELEKRARRTEMTPELLEHLPEAETGEPDAPNPALAEYVARLGEKCQAILVSFYYWGHRMEQVAQEHGYKTIRSATVQKFKCLERLRKSLAAYTIHDFS